MSFINKKLGISIKNFGGNNEGGTHILDTLPNSLCQS